jgi:hypothetical protein
LPDTTDALTQQRALIYDLRQAIHALERELANSDATADSGAVIADLVTKQTALTAAEQALAGMQKTTGPAPTVSATTRSLSTTNLEVQVQPRMTSVPSAIYHLLDPKSDPPLVTCTVTTNALVRRVRITAYIEEYSAKAIDTVEVRKGMAEPPKVDLRPTLRPDMVRTLNELTRASLNVLAEDLDSGKVEIHRTMPVWLLARTSAPLSVLDPASGTWRDLSHYLGAFVTPNAPSVMNFVRSVADKNPDMRLVSYQGDVEAQVKAAFTALKEVANLRYVNSVIDFNPDAGARSQRLRLPRQSLEERQANCVDGAVLFASILESISLNPAIVVLPTHVIVGWETGAGNDKWRYLDTTKIDNRTFEQAVHFGETLAAALEAQRASTGNESWFRRWSLRDLRARGIYPTE